MKRLSGVHSPLRRGVNTELAPSSLHPEMAIMARDCCFIDGVLSQNGGYEFVGDEDGVTGGAGSPNACFRVSFNGGISSKLVMMHDDGYFADVTTDGAPEQIDGPSRPDYRYEGEYLPREIVNNEVLFCPQSGQHPVLRWASGTDADSDAETGTWTPSSDNAKRIIGSSTDFSANDVGRFLGSATTYQGAGTDTGKILSYESSAQITVDHDTLDVSISPSFVRSDLGLFGLYALVTDIGTISISSFTVTGVGTDWDTTQAPTDHGSVLPGDILVLDDGTDVSVTDVAPVTVVGSDTSLTLGQNNLTGASNDKYKILRPLVGTEARLHRGRVYVTGVEWAPQRIYYTRPVGEIPLGQLGNGRDSLTLSAEDALVADYVDVEDRTGGAIIGLTSVTDGILVHRKNSLGMLAGDPVNGFQYYEIGNVGTIDINSIVEYEGKVYFASPDGIYRWSPGALENILEQTRMTEWHDIEVDSCSSGAVDDHLIIYPKSANHDENHEAPWVWDIQREIWVGDWYYNRPPVDFFFRSIIPGSKEELYAVGAGNGGLGAFENTTKGQIARITDLFSSTGVRTYHGAFLLRLPPSIAGVQGMSVKRLTHVKPYYSFYGDANVSDIRTFVGTGPGRILYASVADTASRAITTTSGLGFPLEFTLDFSSSAVDTELEFTLLGEWQTGVTVTITGPVVSPIITFRKADDTLVGKIDCSSETLGGGNDIIIAPNGLTAVTATNAGVAFTPDSFTGTMFAQPGDYEVILEGTGMSAGVTTVAISYYKAYGG